MGRRPLVFAAFVALVGSGLAGRTAAADPSPPPRTPLAQSLSDSAKAAYDAAVILLNNNDCAGAIAKYQEAYDLAKDPRLLFDMAVCERDLRAYARMQGLLLRYEREDAAAMAPEQKVAVEAALVAVHNLVGTVHLTVSEDGADVSVDGEAAGRTPFATPIVLDLGKHALAVKKDGFETVERTVAISGGNETNVTIALVRQPHPAQFRIAADPAATIVIDARELAHGSFDGPLAPGAHDVEVTEPGRKAYETRVVLGDGEARTLEVTLEPEHHTMIWPWVAGGVALVVGASVGGYFLLRPQDTRGPGPQGPLGSFQIPANAN
jgi:PEGA domain-containing protein